MHTSNDEKSAKPVISQSFPVPTASTGTADIVGFSLSGVSVVRNNFSPQKTNAIAAFGYDSGWRVEKHVRLLADTTGKGRLDIVGFGDSAVSISLNRGDNTFQAPKQVTTDFVYIGGWRVEKHIRFMADITGTGRADIVGFRDAGVFVSLNNGDGSFGPTKLAVAAFGYDAGDWRLEKHLRLLADVNGNGLLDVVGFGEESVWIAGNNGDGTFQPPRAAVQNLSCSSGWRVDRHPRFVADLTGNGKPDLIGFGNAGVYVSFNNGDGTFQALRKVYEDFSYDAGWRVDKHLRFIADLTGNGCGDIIGFGDRGVYVAINNGNGTFQSLVQVSEDFVVNTGWSVQKHPRFVADLTGNGRADIIGFGDRGVYAIYNDGSGKFGPTRELILDFGCAGGEWLPEKSVRYVANLYR